MKLNRYNQAKDTNKFAFILAEVLITLGIIGIIAALTLPSLISNYKKHIVETRLKKFYSTINQAIKLAEIEYGDKKLWYENISGGFDADGKAKLLVWFDKYLGNNLKVMKKETDESGDLIVYFPDETVLILFNSTDWVFYTESPDRCSKLPNKTGRCAFYFSYYPLNADENFKYHFNQGVEPYKYGWDGTTDMLYNDSDKGCNMQARDPAYCTALIQLNGWKIPKDYKRKI